MVYATSKFDVGKSKSTKQQRSSKISIHLQHKVNRLLDTLVQYEINSPVNKEEQPKRNLFIKPRSYLS